MVVLEELSTVLASRASRYRKLIRRKLMRLDRSDIKQALASLGEVKSNILFVHSSLSACGHIQGGAAAVIETLLDWVSDGTLSMPTFTYCYPEKTGHIPVFEVDSTPSVVGSITDQFWRRPNILRSLHPSHSIASVGRDSEDLCAGHELTSTPCGAGTPFQRLVEKDCSVLMFGAAMDAYTLFHTAEDAAAVPYLYEPQIYTLRLRDRDGTVFAIKMWRQDSSITRRFGATSIWLQEQRLLVRRRLGFGELLFIPHAAHLHERVVKKLRRDPFFLVAGSARREVARRFAI